MPKPSTHALLWSAQNNSYTLLTPSNPPQEIAPGNEKAWATWLATLSSFSFQGQYGRLTLLKESRKRGTSYWYAYHTRGGQTRKRYLGRSAELSLERLEEVARAFSRETSPAPILPLPKVKSSQQSGILLSTKLSPPRLPDSLVERSRLLTELDAARSYPVTLVCAPAGSGKTTLLSTWVASLVQTGKWRVEGTPGSARREQTWPTKSAEPVVTWLSLDELDSEPIRFWTSIIAALRQKVHTVGEEALALLHLVPSPQLITILSILLNELAGIDTEIILILDDYHVIEDQAIHSSLLFLVDHLPTSLHVVLASRTDPELPLARWRVRGQLIEIRNQDLRFTHEEAATFLIQCMGLPLTKEDVTRISGRTEGWIAGLRLAVLSLSKQQDPSAWIADFAGNSRLVLDYVQQDILASLPDPLQDFLLQSSVVTRMNATLCQALLAGPSREECQLMLEEVERSNLFLVPLDSKQQWYRFHDLFREALLARLHATQSERIPHLHRRAASFYEAAGEWQEAITHALAALDYVYAADLMEQAAPYFWLNGEVRTIHAWVVSLPDEILRLHLRLALDAALRFFESVNRSNEAQFVSIAAQMMLTFTRMGALLQRQSALALTEDEAEWLKQRLQRLRALTELRAISKRGDTRRLRALAQELDILPADDQESWNVLSLFIPFYLSVAHHGDEGSLIPRLRSAKLRIIEAGDSMITIRIMSMLALIYTLATKWHLAQQEAHSAFALLEQAGGRSLSEGYLYYSLSIVCYAQNRLEEATDWLSRLRQIAQDWQQVEMLAMGEIMTVRVALARGDHGRAQEGLQGLKELVEEEGFAHHAFWLNTLRVQCWLAEGKLEAAREWATQSPLWEQTWEPLRRWEVLMLARVWLATQQYVQAAEMLLDLSQYYDQEGSDTAPEWMALTALALYHSGEHEQAIQMAARLFQLAEPEGYARLYLDTEEPIMKQILQLLLAALDDASGSTSPVSLSRSSVSRWLRAFDRAETSETYAGEKHEASTPATRSAPQPQQMAESLSPQERKVLRLLVAGHTYAEMAESLIVSIHTIKTQVGSIYRKLGVSRRAEAITATRHFDLL